MPDETFRTILCPVCRRELRFHSTRELPHFPFCSERCKMVVLGHWLTGGYRIPGEPAGPDEPEKKNS